MPDVRILANIGTNQGYSGNGTIYVGKTLGGTLFAAMKHLESNVEVLRYYRKSKIVNGMAIGDMKIANDFNLNLLTDQVSPDFAPGEGDFPVITTAVNLGATTLLPRLFNLQDPYTLKGENVTAAEIASLKTGATTTNGLRTITGTVTNADGTVTTKYDDGTSSTTTKAGSTDGALGGIIPTDFSLLFSNPIKFFQDNIIFVVILLAVIWFVRKKKKKPFFIF